MSNLFKDCRDCFGSDDLYAVLNVEKEAQDNALKRAYHKLSLKVHPDRVGADEKEVATRKFQTLGRVYSILSDTEKRAVYDETGEVDEENEVAQEKDWYEYWRLLFKKISVHDIREFEDKYKGSDEELSDLVAAYMECEGDLDRIMENVMCATADDEDRFRELLMDKIKKEEIPSYDAFTRESGKKKKQRKKKAAKEAAEAEVMKAELGMTGSGDDSLRNMIAQRQAGRQRQADDFFAQLEAKYAPAKKKSKGKKT